MQPIIALAICLLIGLFLRWILSFIIHRTAQRTNWHDADVIASVLGTTALWTVFLLGIDVCVPIALYPSWIQSYIHPTILACTVLVFAIALPRAIATLFLRHAQRKGNQRTSSTLLQTCLQVGIYLLALTLVLDAYGVKVTTMIATLGIGGLALALALQETLSNLFAGMYITIANQIRVGDVVIFDGNEGVVKDIGWRNTLVRKADESLLITPNSKLSQSIVSTYPADSAFFRTRLVIQLSVDEQIVKAEQIAHDFAISLCANPEQAPAAFIPEPMPVVRLSEAKDGIVELSIMVSAQAYPKMPELRSALFQRMNQLLNDQGIRIHNPLRKSS